MVANKLSGRCGIIVVGLSGGKDSIALLDALLSVNGTFSVAAANVEHGIRGSASLADSEFVRKYCADRGVTCYCKSVDAPALSRTLGISVEQAARQLRYDFFQELLSDGRADCIALAHHLDDQCETVLMRLLRGTGLEGLCGIRERKGYIRPFLNITRREIEDYVLQYKLPFCEDETNSDTAYSRNFLRKDILPLLGERWNYRRSISALTASAVELTAFLDKLSPKPLQKDGAVYLDCKELLSTDAVLAKHAIRRAVRLINGGVDFEEVNCRDVYALVGKGSGTRVDLAGGLRAWRESDCLVFERVVADEIAILPFCAGSFLFAGELWEIRPCKGEALRFDITQIPPEACIRARKQGDSFCKFGGFTLPLGDFYTNIKVPRRLRGRLPLVALGNEILVTPFEISEKVRSSGQNEYTLCRVDGSALAQCDSFGLRYGSLKKR